MDICSCSNDTDRNEQTDNGVNSAVDITMGCGGVKPGSRNGLPPDDKAKPYVPVLGKRMLEDSRQQKKQFCSALGKGRNGATMVVAMPCAKYTPEDPSEGIKPEGRENGRRLGKCQVMTKEEYETAPCIDCGKIQGGVEETSKFRSRDDFEENNEKRGRRASESYSSPRVKSGCFEAANRDETKKPCCRKDLANSADKYEEHNEKRGRCKEERNSLRMADARYSGEAKITEDIKPGSRNGLFGLDDEEVDFGNPSQENCDRGKKAANRGTEYVVCVDKDNQSPSSQETFNNSKSDLTQEQKYSPGTASSPPMSPNEADWRQEEKGPQKGDKVTVCVPCSRCS